MWDVLQPGELPIEVVQASFFIEARGELVVTNRRLLFQARTTRDDGPAVVGVPFKGIAACRSELRRRLDGKAWEIGVDLVGTPFQLRFRLREGDGSLASAVVDAINSGIRNPCIADDWPISPLISVSACAEPEINDGGDQFFFWLEPVWRSLSFVVGSSFREPDSTPVFRVKADTGIDVFIGYELGIFDRLILVREWTLPTRVGIRFAYDRR